MGRSQGSVPALGRAACPLFFGLFSLDETQAFHGIV